MREEIREISIPGASFRCVPALSDSKIAWLLEQGYSGNRLVVDCSPADSTVTYVDEDGDHVTRRLVLTYSRAMGYHAPTARFNPGKRQEHRDRKFYAQPTDEETSNE